MSGFVAFILFAVFYLTLSEGVFAGEHQPNTDTRPIAFVVEYDGGGTMAEYYSRARIMNKAKVIIDGPCLSACTLFLSQKFALDLCITERALFGFHKPYKVSPADGEPMVFASLEPEADIWWTEEFYSVMPRHIQKWLEGKYVPSVTAGDPVSLFLLYTGDDIIPACEDGWWDTYQLRYELN